MFQESLKNWGLKMRTIFLLVLLFPLNFLAHQDKIITIQKSNVLLQYKIGWYQQEIGKVNEILAHLAEKLVLDRKCKEKIIISFTHDYVQWDSSYYSLSYDDFRIIDYQNDCKVHIGRGIKLIIKDRGLNIEKTLSILDNAISNIELIKKKQAQLLIDLHLIMNGKKQFDTLTTIPFKQINGFFSKTTDLVKKLINQRTYRNLNCAETFWNIDYYYQKNKFHFYNTSEPKTEYNPKTGNDDTVNVYGEDVLVVDNILEIFGDWNYGHFVFINDSIFYYIPKFKTNTLGPHKINNVRAGRPPIFRFEIDSEPMLRYTLYVDQYSDFTKALFIPDSNILVSSFNEKENEFIKDLIQRKKPNESEIKSNLDYMKWIILFLLGVSILFNIFFVFRKMVS